MTPSPEHEEALTQNARERLAGLTAKADEFTGQRILAAWAEIKAERMARHVNQMRCVAPKYEGED